MMPAPWWHGSHGQWWVVAQFALLLFDLLVPPAGPRLSSGTGPALWLALLLGATGVGLMVVSAAALGPSLTVLPRPRARAVLVQEGIYRVVRHPIYFGVILLALGWAVWRGSLLHFALAVTIGVFFDTKARREEQWLVERFPDYEDYRRRTRKLIPWIY